MHLQDPDTHPNVTQFAFEHKEHPEPVQMYPDAQAEHTQDEV